MKGKSWAVLSAVLLVSLSVQTTALSGQVTRTRTTSAQSTSLNVPGTSTGTNTGIIISEGDQIQFIAVGEVNTYPDAPDPQASWGGPDGNPYDCTVECLLPSARFGALIGRIGEADWFLIGSRKSLAADASGELVLAVNDTIHSNNTGSYTVSLDPPFFYDDFDDPELDPAWFWVREDRANWSLAERPSHLRIHTQPGTPYPGNPLPENMLFRNAPTFHFEVSTRFEITPTEDYQEAGLMLYEDDDNYIKISRLYNASYGEDVLALIWEQDGSVQFLNHVPFTRTVVALELEHEGNRVIGSYRDQSGDWTELDRINIPEASRFSFLGVAAHNGGGSDTVPSIPADFDFVQASPSVPLLLQTSLPWGDDPYAYYPADGINDIGKWGCYTTSGAMLVNYWGRTVEPQFSTDPGLLDTWLKTHEGYEPYPDNVVRPWRIADYAQLPTNGVPLYHHSLVDHRDDDVLEDYIFSGYPTIVRVGKHFVVVTGKTKVAGEDTYKINDPLYDRRTTLYEQWGGAYHSIRLFANHPADQRTLRISAHSPVELLITDPLGNKSGFDPRTGVAFDEIPYAAYVTETIAADADPSQGEFIESKYLEAGHPIDGNYLIQVIGTDTGAYGVAVVAANSLGRVSVTRFAGSAFQGSSDIHTVAYDSHVGLATSFLYLPAVHR